MRNTDFFAICMFCTKQNIGKNVKKIICQQFLLRQIITFNNPLIQYNTSITNKIPYSFTIRNYILMAESLRRCQYYNL